ncbi:MAG: hypothetical protein ACRCTA_00885, partial [Bacilli bacterium]
MNYQKYNDFVSGFNNINKKELSTKKLLIAKLLIFIVLVISIYLFKIPVGFNNSFILTLIMFLVINLILDFFIIAYYSNKSIKYSVRFSLSLILIIIVIYIIGSALFQSKRLSKITTYQTIKKEELFKEDNKLILVDSLYAKLLADKALGEKRLGNHYHVGEFDDIMYQGSFYSIAPLEFNGLIKWFNKKTSPGYVMVNKYNGEVSVIDTYKIKYLNSSYFNKNINRKIALKGINEKYGYRFELDDEGNPYAIFNNYQRDLLLNFETTNQVYTMNLENGQTKSYSLKEAPEWVDNLVHPNYAREKLEYHLVYQKGFFNAQF